MPSAFVTGAAGQDGILLARLLVSKGYDVWGLVKPRAAGLPKLRELVPTLKVLEGDLRDSGVLEHALERSQPDEVYNLGAFSSVARSWAHAADVMSINVVGTTNLLDAVVNHRTVTNKEVRFYQASSSEMFGEPNQTPQTEETPFHPRSPYGVSKAAAHYLAVNYRESYELHASCGILYNHESEFRGREFVTRKITRGVAEIEAGKRHKLELGNLDVSRDWGYAPDYVDAMWLMLQQDQPGDYVIASGESRELREFLAESFRCIGVDDWSSYVTSDPSLYRPAEVSRLVGDPTKAKTELGWNPQVPFREMIAKMVEYDRRSISAEDSRH